MAMNCYELQSITTNYHLGAYRMVCVLREDGGGGGDCASADHDGGLGGHVEDAAQFGRAEAGAERFLEADVVCDFADGVFLAGFEADRPLAVGNEADIGEGVEFLAQ